MDYCLHHIAMGTLSLPHTLGATPVCMFCTAFLSLTLWVLLCVHVLYRLPLPHTLGTCFVPPSSPSHFGCYYCVHMFNIANSLRLEVNWTEKVTLVQIQPELLYPN